MKKRSVDLYYALPLTHTKILLVNFLVGIIELYFIYTVAYWLGAISVILNIKESIKPIYYIPQYFATLLPLYFIYAITSFIYTRANSAGDGFAFSILWFFAASLIMLFLVVILPSEPAFLYPGYYLPSAPLDAATTYFQYLIAGDSPGGPYTIFALPGFLYTALLAAGSTAGLFLTDKNTKAENAGQISDSWFGYKVMIPIYTVCLISMTIYLGAVNFLTVLIIIAMFVLTATFKRSMKIGKTQSIIFIASVLAGIFIGCIIGI